MSKSTRGFRAAGIASLAVSVSIGVAAPAFAVEGFTLERIGGEDRYETAALVADEYSATNDNVILANGQPGFYADALASNYLAGVLDAPILLTNMKQIPEYTLDQLDQMNAQTVTVVGGEGVVPPAQVEQLEDAGYTVERVAGDDRFETNADVIAEGGDATGGIGLIATGFDFPDALAAGPFAYQGHPLGLSTEDSVKDVVLDALVADGVEEVLIFGGESVVGQGVEDDLASRGITVLERFDGDDRSDTSELAAEWALENLDFVDTHVGVASGYTEGYGADALAGGPLEGKEMSPMLITRNVDNPDDALDYIAAHSDTLEDGHLYGGPGAVSVAAEAAMEEAGQGDVTTNQDFVGTPSEDQAVEDGAVVQFSFSGITSDTVDIALFDCSNVDTDEDGVTTFSGTNPGGAGNVAQEDNAPSSVITVINGSVNPADPDANYANDVDSADGTVTFSVDTTGDSPECFVAVVFDDADDDNNLDLGANGQPTESFGNSGDVTVLPDEANEGTFNVSVDDYNKDANYFVGGDPAETYYYDANDEFLLEAGATDTALTMEQFEQRLSLNDNVSGNYRTNPANQSTFLLVDDSPAAPAVDAEPNTDEGGITVTLTLAGAADDNIDSFRIYRAAANDNITPLPSDCDLEDSAYTAIGSVVNDTTKDTETFDDTTAVTGAEYCYQATSVEGTDEGPRSAADGPETASAAATQSAPEFLGAEAADGATVLTVEYDEDIQCDTVDSNGSNYAVSILNGDGSETGLTETAAECVTPVLSGTEQADEFVEITVSETLNAGDTIIVRAKNGADGNTVLDLAGVAQPTTDAVQTVVTGGGA